jgi:hypothetical protein
MSPTPEREPRSEMNQILQITGADESHSCRLCEGATTFRFNELVLNTHTVRYWRCSNCGSMQTDRPYWLAEAYASVHSATDTGMVARTLQMAHATSLLLSIACVGPDTVCLDWGGGNGLFCRMMRDQGYNFLCKDKYAEPFYCTGFTADHANLASCDVVTSFEVFEHLADPRIELAEIARLKPQLWIFSTQLYSDQERDWNYFGPRQGRHVFFYSEKALNDFAAEHDFSFMRGRHLHMFARRGSKRYLESSWREYLARHVLRGNRLATLSAAVNFQARQRHAYLRWQSDSEEMKTAAPPIAHHGAS